MLIRYQPWNSECMIGLTRILSKTLLFYCCFQVLEPLEAYHVPQKAVVFDGFIQVRYVSAYPKRDCCPSSSTCNLNDFANLFISRNFQLPFKTPWLQLYMEHLALYSIRQCTGKVVSKTLRGYTACGNWCTFTSLLWAFSDLKIMSRFSMAAIESYKVWAKKPKVTISPSRLSLIMMTRKYVWFNHH